MPGGVRATASTRQWLECAATRPPTDRRPPTSADNDVARSSFARAHAGIPGTLWVDAPGMPDCRINPNRSYAIRGRRSVAQVENLRHQETPRQLRKSCHE